MYGNYVCERCGTEVDPNELHNGICDDCLAEEKEKEQQTQCECEKEKQNKKQ